MGIGMEIEKTLYIDRMLAGTYRFNIKNGSEITIGRAQRNDIVIQSSIVSSQHGKIIFENDHAVICDLNSTNGLWVNDQRIDGNLLLENGNNIHFSDINDESYQGNYIEFKKVVAKEVGNWKKVPLKRNSRIGIGRKSDNDIIVPHNLVSRNHAIIESSNDEIYITDLNSTNGTFVNGKRVEKRRQLQIGDKVYVGQVQIIVYEDELSYFIYEKGLQLDAIQIFKEVIDSSTGIFGGEVKKSILNNINIQIKPGELVALVGGSGAGKSTLMDALNGFRPATSGKILINDDDFYTNYEAFKSILGYVPQQDIVYDTLTVQDMLTYAARLRMPEDVSEADIHDRVSEVITDVELNGREHVIIDKLSGGQRKRASIAVELLADPKLFFLDEPTSGLDPAMERHMMKLLRKLADQGKTIVLITHATANLHLCDHVAFLGYGGVLCYYGPPGNDCYHFFQTKDYADIYELIDQEAHKWSKKWEGKYARSVQKSEQDQLIDKEPGRKKIRHKSGHGLLKQFQILSFRYMKLVMSDQQKTLFILLQAPLIAIFLGIVTESNAFEYYETAKEVIFTIAAAAVWIGMLNSIQEIAKESTIYKRERAVNLKILPYLFSKMIVLSIVGFIQTLSFILVFMLFIDFPATDLIGNLFVEIFITFFLTTITATAFGLLISSCFSNPDRAMGLAPVLLIPQLIFNGLVFKLEGFTEVVSYLVISKWSARALSVSYDLNGLPMEIETKIAVPTRDLPLYFDHNLSLLLQNWLILIIFAVVCLLLGLVVLKRSD